MQAPRRIAFTIALQFVFAFMIVVSLCVRHEAKTTASIPSLRLVSENMEAKDQKAVIDAINRLKESCDEWKHLDPTIVRRVVEQAKFGPEANVKVRIQDKGGKPVSGALVLLVESEYDMRNSIDPTPRFGIAIDLPLAMRVSDDKGEVQFLKVRRTHPGLNPRTETTVANAFIFVLHPDRACEVRILAPHDDMQELEIQLEEFREHVGRIVDEAGQGVKDVMFAVNGYSVYETDWRDPSTFGTGKSHFRMQTKSDANGFYRIKTAPREGWISYSLEHPSWQKLYKVRRDRFIDPSDKAVNLENEKVELVVKPKVRRYRKFRLIDEDEGTPIPDARISDYRNQVAISHQDGTFEFENYSTYYDNEKKTEIISFAILPQRVHYAVSYSCPLLSEEETVDIRLRQGVVVSGRVVDEVSGLPLPDVCLSGKVDEEYATNGTSPLASATTDKEGRFTLLVPKCKVEIQVVSGVYGYEVSIPPLVDPFGGDNGKETWKPLGIAVDASNPDMLRKEVVFALKRIRPIRGSVIDEEENPIEGATVYTTAAFHDCYWKSTARSNEKGLFEVLPPPGFNGPFKFVVEHGEQAAGQELKVNNLGSYVGPLIDVQLTKAQRMHTITGYVIVDGKGLHGARVAIDESERRDPNTIVMSRRLGPHCFAGCTTTDRDGRFEIHTPFPAKSVEYTSRIHSPEYLSRSQFSSSAISPRGTRTDFPDLNFRTRYGDLAVGGEIITPDGEPVAGASITAIYEERVQLIRKDKQTDEGESRTVFSNADGKFSCKGLGKGKVQLQIHPRKTDNDPWSDAMFQSVYTNGGKEDLVVVLDPKLATPPTVVEPVRISPLNNRQREAIQSNGKETTLSGRITDSKKKSLKNALVKFFAARPIDGLPDRFPLAHPLCELETRTDTEGMFSFRIPSLTYKVRIFAYFEGFEGQLSDYIDCEKDREKNFSLAEVPGESRQNGIVIDAEKAPIAEALCVKCQPFFGKEADEIGLESPVTVTMTNAAGEIEPTKDPNQYMMFFFKKGFGANVLGGFNIEPFKLRPSFSFEGRIVDDKGPLSNYPLLLCGRQSSFHTRIMTDDEGRFRFDEVSSANAFDGEVYLSSDLLLQDPRGWLDTRCIKRASTSECLQLPDLKVTPTRSLTVNLVDAGGKPIDSSFEVTFHLRQRGKGTSHKGKGSLTITALPTEPILMGLGFPSPHEVLGVEPMLSKVGFEHGLTYAMQLEKDSEITITAVPRR